MPVSWSSFLDSLFRHDGRSILSLVNLFTLKGCNMIVFGRAANEAPLAHEEENFGTKTLFLHRPSETSIHREKKTIFKTSF